jgi:hypothetical protein
MTSDRQLGLTSASNNLAAGAAGLAVGQQAMATDQQRYVDTAAMGADAQANMAAYNAATNSGLVAALGRLAGAGNAAKGVLDSADMGPTRSLLGG